MGSSSNGSRHRNFKNALIAFLAPLPSILFYLSFLNHYHDNPNCLSPLWNWCFQHPLLLSHILFFLNVNVLFWVIGFIQSSHWMIDLYWTVIPVLLVHYYATHPLAEVNKYNVWRSRIVIFLTWVWSIRLTHNYFRRENWQWGVREDWRFTDMSLQFRDRKEDLKYSPTFDGGDNGFRESVPSHTVDQRSILVLEVIAGPSCGARYSIKSTNSSRLPLTLGRVSPSDLLLKDSEVSGKHALINWNADKLGWELVDMGSLNGTLLNSQAINHPHTGSRHWGDPVEIGSGDIITLGTTSKILVQISSTTESQIPFGVGVVSDAMALRRGGKKLPMEDVCFYHWPLPGTEQQFGLFAVCDGHGGPSAAISASKIMPEMFSSILSDANRREKVLSQGDASDVLREAFCQTEACMNHYYEGCTATALLVWADGNENFLAQCANLGDSACFMIIDGKQVKMTEDHRISSFSERLRMQEVGAPLKDGETRICGINLARMLGDKFLKQQDPRFSSEPYISQVVYINQASRGFALMASDGFWDVVNVRKACQLIQQTKERNIGEDGEKYAEKVASCLLNEARTQRTKDNTSIIFLDFDNVVYRINSSCKVDDH